MDPSGLHPLCCTAAERTQLPKPAAFKNSNDLKRSPSSNMVKQQSSERWRARASVGSHSAKYGEIMLQPRVLCNEEVRSRQPLGQLVVHHRMARDVDLGLAVKRRENARRPRLDLWPYEGQVKRRVIWQQRLHQKYHHVGGEATVGLGPGSSDNSLHRESGR